MIGIVVRLGFWSALALLAMPSSRDQLLNKGFSPSSLVAATDLALGDVGNFCAHNISMCESAGDMASEMTLVAKNQLLEAYHGIRTQFDGPDEETMTGSIRKPNDLP